MIVCDQCRSTLYMNFIILRKSMKDAAEYHYCDERCLVEDFKHHLNVELEKQHDD